MSSIEIAWQGILHSFGRRASFLRTGGFAVATALLLFFGYGSSPVSAQVVFNSGVYSGPTTVTSPFTIDTTAATSSNPMYLDVGSLATSGVTTIEGQGFLETNVTSVSDPSWNNSGTINFADDTSVAVNPYYNYYYRLNNTGTIEKTGGTGTSTVAMALDNYGTINVAAGTSLEFTEGVTLEDGSNLTGAGTWLLNGNTTFNGTTSLAANSTLQLTGYNDLAGTGTISGGTVLWKDGTLSGNATINASNWVIDTSAATNGKAMYLDMSTLNTGGVTTIKGEGALYTNVSATGAPVWNNSGTINFADDTSVNLDPYYGYYYRLNNTGTIEKTGGTGTSTVAVGLNNQAGGLVDGESGTLAFTEASTNAGMIHAGSGATVAFTGGLDLSDGSQVTGGGTVAVSGNDSLNGTTSLGANSTLQLTGYNDLAGTGTISGGTVLWKDGTLTGNATINASNWVIDTTSATTAAPMYLGMSTLTTSGVTTIKGQGFLETNVTSVSDPSWNNSGTINFADDTSVAVNPYYNYYYQLNNTGTIEKTGGTGTSTVAMALDNYGTINVAAGTSLEFTEGVTLEDGSNLTGAGTWLLNGNTTFNGTTSLGANSTLQLTGSNNLAGTGTISGGTVLWKDGTLSGNATINASNFVIDTSTATPSAPMYLDMSTLNTGGVTTIKGEGALYTNVSATGAPVWNNSGTINFADDTSVAINSYYNYYYRLNNTGTIEKTGGTGTSTVAVGLNNQVGGLVDGESGTLAFTEASTNAGTIHAGSGATVAFTGGLDLSDGSQVTGGGTVAVSGNDSLNGTTSLGANSTLQLTGYNDLAGTGTISGGTVLWKDGTLTGNATINASNWVIDTTSATTAAPMYLGMSTLSTGGLTTIKGGGFLETNVLSVSDPSWNNSGTINFADDTSVAINSYYNFYYRLNNTGTIEKTGGTGTSTVAVGLNNQAGGLVDGESGTLAFTEASTNAGTIHAGSGATVAFSSGLSNSGAIQAEATGQVQVSGGYTQSAKGSFVGQGSISGGANVSGLLEAKNSGLSVSGNLTLNSDATLVYGGSDIDVTGNLTINGSSLELEPVLANAIVPIGSVYDLLSYSGTESGLLTFDGQTLANGSTLADGANDFLVNYASSDGAVTLTATTGLPAVPTPTTPLSTAGPTSNAYVSGSQTLPQTTTTVASVQITPGSTLTMYAGQELVVPDGLYIDKGGKFQGSGTIDGDVFNSGVIDLLLGDTLQFTAPPGTTNPPIFRNGPGGTVYIGGSAGDAGGSIDISGLADFENDGDIRINDPANPGPGTPGTPFNPIIGDPIHNRGQVELFSGLVYQIGNYTQTSTGEMIFHIDGYTQAQPGDVSGIGHYSFWHTTGTANLEGTFDVVLDNNFEPGAGFKFDIFEADGGVTINPDDFTIDLPTGFTYQWIDDGTVLELTSTEAVPEPASWALGLVGVGVAVYLRRRGARA